jgi:hypothetical protein
MIGGQTVDNLASDIFLLWLGKKFAGDDTMMTRATV